MSMRPSFRITASLVQAILCLGTVGLAAPPSLAADGIDPHALDPAGLLNPGVLIDP